MTAPLRPNQGRGVACGFWFNFGGQTCTTLNINEDGTVALSVGTPDIGGSRASMCLMAAEELGIPYDKRALHRRRHVLARLQRHDRRQPRHLLLRHGDDQRRRDAIKELCQRAAKMWGIAEDAVIWDKRPRGAPAPTPATSRRCRWRRSRRKPATPAGRSPAITSSNADGAGVSFATHICDVEVDPETGRSRIVRYTVLQDAGKAIHPAYVEGQYQGGAAQGIGWALNEEYIYGADGTAAERRLPRLPHSGVLRPADDRHGDRRGAQPRTTPTACAAWARPRSCRRWRRSPTRCRTPSGVRMTHLPMSPPRVLRALEMAGKAKAAA